MYHSPPGLSARDATRLPTGGTSADSANRNARRNAAAATAAAEKEKADALAASAFRHAHRGWLRVIAKLSRWRGASDDDDDAANDGAGECVSEAGAGVLALVTSTLSTALLENAEVGLLLLDLSRDYLLPSSFPWWLFMTLHLGRARRHGGTRGRCRRDH